MWTRRENGKRATIANPDEALAQLRKDKADAAVT